MRKVSTLIVFILCLYFAFGQEPVLGGQGTVQIVGFVVTPTNRQVDLISVERLILHGEFYGLNEWAKQNRFLLIEIDRSPTTYYVALVHQEILYSEIEERMNLINFLSNYHSDKPLVLDPKDSFVKSFLNALARPNNTTYLSFLSSDNFDKEILCAIQPYTYVVADLKIGGHLYNILLRSLTPSISPETLLEELPDVSTSLTKASQDSQESQGTRDKKGNENLEDKEALKVAITGGDMLRADEKARLISRVFYHVHKNIEKQSKKVEEVINSWKEEVTSKELEAYLRDWNSWSQLPDEIQNSIIRHPIIQETIKDRSDLYQISVRLRIGVGFQLLRQVSPNRFGLYLVPFDDETGVVVSFVEKK